MYPQYVEHCFGKNFFSTLCSMKLENLLVGDENNHAKIYLPFIPHFFYMVNCNEDITSNFTISYLKECDIGIDNHKLSYSSSCHTDDSAMNKCLEEEERHMKTTRKAILNYDIGLVMTKQTCTDLLEDLGDVTEIRYIILTSKPNLNPNKNDLSDYTFSKKNFVKKANYGIKSMLLEPSCKEELSFICKIITRQLILNPPDSFWGISIVVDNLECNRAMLNVERPGVLRQYYGRDVKKIDKDTVLRVAYRSQTSFSSEGSDPEKLIIKPFNAEMSLIANYLSKFLIFNRDKLNLHSVDLSNNFNSCTILLYHALPNYKERSSMGWHCDSKYTTTGKFSEKMNGQKYNTPVIIFTIGRERLLKWRKRYTHKRPNGYKSFEVEPFSEEEMLMKEGHICLIHPFDEEPHFDFFSNKIIHFQHGDTKVIENDISIAFVFRVSNHECICSIHDNKVILPEIVSEKIKIKEQNGVVNQKDRIEKYTQFDISNYHNSLKSHFENYYNV